MTVFQQGWIVINRTAVAVRFYSVRDRAIVISSQGMFTCDRSEIFPTTESALSAGEFWVVDPVAKTHEKKRIGRDIEMRAILSDGTPLGETPFFELEEEAINLLLGVLAVETAALAAGLKTSKAQAAALRRKLRSLTAKSSKGSNQL